MVRLLTGGWVPYATSTERGSLKHCLVFPDILRVPPASKTGSVQTSPQPRTEATNFSRRQILKYTIGGAATLGVLSTTPQPCSAGIFGFLAAQGIRFAIPTIKWFLAEVIKGVAEAATHRVIDYYLSKKDEDLVSSFTQSKKPLHTGQAALVHDAYADDFWYPEELKVPTKRSKDFATDIGLDRIQWQINNSLLEQKAMEMRAIPGASPVFRTKGYSQLLRADFRDANMLYVPKDEEPFTEAEVEYTIPILSNGGKQHTAFCVKRAARYNVLIVETNN